MRTTVVVPVRMKPDVKAKIDEALRRSRQRTRNAWIVDAIEVKLGGHKKGARK